MGRFSIWKFLMPAAGVVLVAVLLAETVVVKVQTTYLRKEPTYFSPVVSLLKAGENLTQVAAESGWIKVKTAAGVEGWLHSSAVQKKKWRLAAVDRSLQARASAEEVALAGKGFNKQVEAEYASRRGVSFDAVNRMLQIKVTLQEIEQFMKAGRLGEFGGSR